LAGSADAVVMVERTQKVDERTIEVLRPVAPGENVVQSGEDVRRGDPVLPKGQVIRPQDIGGALALGLTTLKVSRKPRVAIVSTGDELVAPHQRPGPGQIRDINTYTISGLVSSCGGLPIHVGMVEDDFEAQKSVAAEALDMGDIVVFSAGSSVSSRDLTASVFDSLGDPGVLAHGIAIKPGKPTVMGMVDGKPLIGLPGNPVSAMVVFDITVRPAIYHLSGCVRPPTLATTTATLTRDIPSQAGREDYVQVRLSEQDGTLEAEPIFGKSNLIYTLVRADGVLRVPLEKGGIYAGEEVSVRVY
ncbi:MAG: molybdopterin molybdotransferase MoeA, partial [Chloroflexi bacterium]|nr:molybdopterin molybdotransferase MoeA [Chloroflexota bacterium]